jgi:hypothetical protein
MHVAVKNSNLTQPQVSDQMAHLWRNLEDPWSTGSCKPTCSKVFSGRCAWRNRCSRCTRGCRNASPSSCLRIRRTSAPATLYSWRRLAATADKTRGRGRAPAKMKAGAVGGSDVPTEGTGVPGTVPRDEDSKTPVNNTPAVALEMAQPLKQSNTDTRSNGNPQV